MELKFQIKFVSKILLIQVQFLQVEKNKSKILQFLDVNPNLENVNSHKYYGIQLNLKTLPEQKCKPYHDEVYSKLHEFSESWRKLAIEEKRF